MGREVRKVPLNWQHPKDERGHHVPLHDGSFLSKLNKWLKEKEMWDRGYMSHFNYPYPDFYGLKDVEYKDMPFEEWSGRMPIKEEYMPEWPKDERTYMQMYETCTEGTPISPVMDTPENLACWLTDNDASAFGNMTASYEAWLCVCKSGYAPSAILSERKLESGVEACKKEE